MSELSDKDKLLQYPNVIGAAHQPEYVNGMDTGHEALTAYVTQKVPERRLDPAERIPADVDGYPTDVVQADFTLDAPGYDYREHPFPNRKEQFNPVPGGVQVQLDGADGVGTLAGPLLELPDGTPCMLTNEHVAPGDPGQAVYHPDTDGRQIGTVYARSQTYSGERPDKRDTPAKRDYALIRLDNATGAGHVLGMDDAPDGFAERPPEKYETVRKSGRTTGLSDGIVFTVDAKINVKVGETDGGDDIRVPFEPVAAATYASAGGDSGSVVINEDDNITGIHFAGGAVAAFLPIQPVLADVGDVRLVERAPGDSDDGAAPSVWVPPVRVLRRAMRHLTGRL
jgi:hypothetical protein